MFKHIKSDLPASIVVFLVALPLCLGIALASGAPLFSGVISGIIGGVMVGALSGSSLGVSGPAAGLAVIILNGITDLGGFDIILVAIMLAGIIQVIMGYAKAGAIANYFPSSVIHGMLAGIGILIFLKQLPHAVGYDAVPEGDEAFLQPDHQNTFSEISNMFSYISPGIVIITAISLFILILWQSKFIQKNKIAALLPGPLLAVVAGITLNFAFANSTTLAVSAEHLVALPVSSSTSSFWSNFTLPNFAALGQVEVYTTAIIIAVIASIETLLCVEASDKIDPDKRITPKNRELKAQGIGNIIAGLIGGLPVTQVIVRSSANQQAGGKSKLSTIFHGLLLLISVIAIPTLLNQIPLATLAAILLIVGFKLAKPALFKEMYGQGMGQFIPFFVTVVSILLTDLLTGILLGLLVAIIVIIINNFRTPYVLQVKNENNQKKYRLVLSEDVSFLNKASILKILDRIPKGEEIEIDTRQTRFMHYDVNEIIENFIEKAAELDIKVKTISLEHAINKKNIQKVN
ncbi:SulP family inorganic anion transporter [Putridiphycobacter roseus]|uniref:SulP family inorganic anion transporter n=1 Tax=Putridiphycobacter roseus TaxID=2219161 RepID=A0A2W1N5R8_9FLAO|nr:SulP family inorganic anion transporter [Putridiphycobacter roseus]